MRHVVKIGIGHAPAPKPAEPKKPAVEQSEQKPEPKKK